VQSQGISGVDSLKGLTDSLEQSEVSFLFSDKEGLDDLALAEKYTETIKLMERKQKSIMLIAVSAILVIGTLLILLWFMYRRGIKFNKLLIKQNQDIIKQRTKISGQRDKLSELAFELKKLNKTKDKFFSVLAHDLKNPFQSLSGFSELLVAQIKEGDYANALKYSEIIHETSYNTYVLLENFLNWARVQSGLLKYHPELLSLTEIVSESIEISRFISDAKQIKIRSDVREEEQVYADRYMIATTIRNLISNAVKYSNPGGEIVIDTVGGDSKYKMIQIKDFGTGIKPDVMNRLFKISNYSALGTREEKGTGLGLIICKEFSLLNKGDLFVESVIGQGSTFTIKVPAIEHYN
jgi:signal transduction histidine kinase